MEKVEYRIYPVYFREGYGFQQDNPEGTNGIPEYYCLYEEASDGGEGYEIVSFGPTMIHEMQAVVDYLNSAWTAHERRHATRHR